MASPQKENGYTAIANEILESLARLDIIGSQFAIILAVIRKTYGFKKKEDQISISQLMEMTSLSRRTVIYHLQDLEAKRVLFIKRVRNGSVNETNIVMFNKNYDQWVVQNSSPQTKKNRELAKISSAKRRGSAKLQQKVVQNSDEKVNSFAPTKETITKDNTKESTAQSAGRLGNEVIHLFKEVNPSYESLFKRRPQHAAAERLLGLHGFERIQKIVSFIVSRREDKYCPTITTPTQLEDKWAALEKYARGLKGNKREIIV